MSADTREILVIVHPSWPWQTRHEVRSDVRSALLKRAELILARLVDLIAPKDRPYCALVGPFLNVGCGLSAFAIDQLRALSRDADMRLPGGLDRDSLVAAGRIIGVRWRQPRRVRIAGFYRDLCCAAVADGIRYSGAQEVILDRALSRACPPEASGRLW
jgi:hypothetical protein